MSATDSMFEEWEMEEGAAGAWWIFVLTGLAWLLLALLVFH